MANSTISPQFKKFMDKFATAVKNAEEAANKEIAPEISDYVARKIAPAAKKEVQQAYVSAVDAWYDAYAQRKRYRPKGTLYHTLEFEDQSDDGEILTWDYVDDNLDRPSIYNSDNTYNIYNMAMERGSHGNPLPYYPHPFKSDPLLDIFREEKKPKVVTALLPSAALYAQEYYSAHIEEKFLNHFNI